MCHGGLRTHNSGLDPFLIFLSEFSGDIVTIMEELGPSLYEMYRTQLIARNIIKMAEF